MAHLGARREAVGRVDGDAARPGHDDDLVAGAQRQRAGLAAPAAAVAPHADRPAVLPRRDGASGWPSSANRIAQGRARAAGASSTSPCGSVVRSG